MSGAREASRRVPSPIVRLRCFARNDARTRTCRRGNSWRRTETSSRVFRARMAMRCARRPALGRTRHARRAPRKRRARVPAEPCQQKPTNMMTNASVGFYPSNAVFSFALLRMAFRRLKQKDSRGADASRTKNPKGIERSTRRPRHFVHRYRGDGWRLSEKKRYYPYSRPRRARRLVTCSSP